MDISRKGLINGLKMARFQQNIRKMSEKKSGANKLLPAVANGFYTVTDSDCVALSWFDDLVLDILLKALWRTPPFVFVGFETTGYSP